MNMIKNKIQQLKELSKTQKDFDEIKKNIVDIL